MNYLHNPTFFIKTLGCKVNQCESDQMRECLIEAGFRESIDVSNADLYIINSCTVTHRADRETRRLIRYFHTSNPEAKIIVAGCYAETDKDRLSLSRIDGVTHLIRNKGKDKILEIIRTEFNLLEKKVGETPRRSRKRDRVFVKIQDGCDNRCSYCKVSIVRGASISKAEDEILSEVTCLVSNGFKEIVLTGVCLGAWGRDFKNPLSLSDLLKKICSVDGDFRIRLSSIEPQYVTDQLIQIISESPKICRHLHLSLQSGDEKILRMMNRKYTPSEFLTLLKRIRKKMPKVAFTTDLIVGFPGEDDRSFKKTYKFIKKAKPSRVHIFTYSTREGTRAFDFKDLPPDVKVKKRLKMLQELAKRIALGYANIFKNKTVPVLVESNRDKHTNLLTGYTDTYIKVFLDGPDKYFNHIIPSRISEVSEKGIFAIQS